MNHPMSPLSQSNNEFYGLLWAMAGGIFVAFGLIIERAAEFMNERFLARGYEPHKKLETWGWRILMVGILVEIVDASLATNDTWQTRQMAIKNDPNNIPIQTLSAYVLINVRTNGFDLNGLIDSGDVGASARIRTIPPQSQNLASINLAASTNGGGPLWLQGCVGYKCLVGPKGRPTIRYDVYFDPQGITEPNTSITANDIKSMRVWLINEWKRPPEVAGGLASIIINGTISKSFVIPEQTNQFAEAFGVITNSDFMSENR